MELVKLGGAVVPPESADWMELELLATDSEENLLLPTPPPPTPDEIGPLGGGGPDGIVETLLLPYGMMIWPSDSLTMGMILSE